jgi:uncharacterized protein HemX
MDALMEKLGQQFAAAPRGVQKFIIFALLCGSVVSSVWAVQDYREQSRRRAVSLEEKVRVLSESLNSSVRAITEVENEIKKRQEIVAWLKKDAETASNVITVSRDQMEAITEILRSEQDRSFWGNQALAPYTRSWASCSGWDISGTDAVGGDSDKRLGHV